MTDERAQELINKAMESGSLKQRNVVGVITGLMGSGKTTLLRYLFGMAPPDLYTSTGVAEQSFRGLLHHIVRLSAGAWERITHKNICEFLAPLIRIGFNEARVDSLARSLMRSIDPDVKNPSFSSPTISYEIPEVSKSHTCKKLVPLVQKAVATGPPEDLVLELVHMIDTGGQPELMEVMPSLIHNANLALVLVSLEYGLNECPEANYHEEGVRYERQMSSHYTGRDIILKLASTFQAKKSIREPFNLFIVATHRDCVKGELKNEVETLNNELHSLLLPTFKNELIIFEASTEFDEENKIAFVLNLKAPNDDDKEALELIRTGVSNSDLRKTFDTPASFFAFEQDLLQYAKDIAKRSILSLHECKQVGAKVKMSSETVEAALVFFHRQNTFLYFKHVLPNHIFIEPQIPFDIVNGIVRFSYKKMRGIKPRLMSLLKDGIITEELLSYDQISSHFVKGFYEVKDAIKLFCHTFTLAPLQPDTPGNPVDRKEREYLMMCLQPAKSDKEIENYVSKITDTVPLVVKFSSGCVPLGCFGSTIACLLYKYKWEVLKGKNSPKCLAHNIAHLHDPDLLVNVVLVDFTQYIKIYISSDLSAYPSPARMCSQVRRKVFGAIEEVFDIMHLDWDMIKISPAVVCECTSIHHFAEFSRNSLYCSESTSTSRANEKQLLWMGKDTNLQPELPELLRLKIPEKVGISYKKFGTFLLDDRKGQLVQNIEFACNRQPDSIVINILRSWLTNEPTPVTWENLIQTLRKSNLNALADDMERSHSTGECSSLILLVFLCLLKYMQAY